MSNPLNWSGPEFLKLYVLLLVLAVIAAMVVRYLVRRSTASPAALGPYELAYLAGGPQRVALVAVSALINDGQAAMGGRQLVLTGTAAGGRDGLLRRLVAAAPPAFSPRAVPRIIAGDIDLIRQTLQSQELIVRGDGVWLSRLVTLLTLGGVLAVGATKAYVGLSRNRPVSLLLLACVVTAGLLIALSGGLFRTTAGEALLRQVRVKRPEPWRASQQNGGDEMLVALWGLSALQSHAAYTELRSMLGQSQRSSDAGGSSCSSSSCSSGSGCGGGGCGGCSS